MFSENLDKIQGLVEDKFKEIRNIDRNCPRFVGEPCTSEHLQVHMVLLNFLCWVKLSFGLADFAD